MVTERYEEKRRRGKIPHRVEMGGLKGVVYQPGG